MARGAAAFSSVLQRNPHDGNVNLMNRDERQFGLAECLAFLRRVGNDLVDVVYPPVCCGCGRLMGRHRAVCAPCWSTLQLIERPYCEILGAPFAHDHGEGTVSPEAIAQPPAFDRLRSVAVHEGIARDLVHGLKYRDRTDLAPMMAEWMVRASDGAVASADAIVPVPLHAFRLWGRKYNQAAELARVIAALSGRPYLPAVLRRIRRTTKQVGLGAKAVYMRIAEIGRVADLERQPFERFIALGPGRDENAAALLGQIDKDRAAFP